MTEKAGTDDPQETARQRLLQAMKVVQLRLGREPSTPMLVDYTHDYEHMLRPGGAPHHLKRIGIEEVEGYSAEFRALASDLWSFAQKTHQP